MRVVFVVGSTASGKSAFALKKAQENKGAIVNCDSIQLYQGLKVGSALPTEKEMSSAPHFLFSYVPTGQRMTAGQYARDFYALMAKIEDQFEVVYVVGGTGFYFQAIEKGLFDVQRPNQELRAAIEKEMETPEGAKKIYLEMLSLDPMSSEKIHEHDHYRIARAVELMRVEKKPLTQIWEEFGLKNFVFPWPLKKIGIRMEKENLLPRVEKRTDQMLQQGLIEEVQQLLSENQSLENWEALQSVGYRETLQYLKKDSEIPDLQALRAKIVQNTMKLAKKQRTWFRRDQNIQWIEPVEGPNS